MKIAAAYIRVSTEEQTELSPDSQIKLIREYAKSHDMIIPEEYVFSDEGISGRKAEKRPGFMKMIGVAKTKPKPFEIILVWKYSRFARNREDSIVYKSMLRKQCGIDVISISEQLGEDKTSILIEALLEAMDEYYSINLSEEVKRGMLEKVERGGCVSSPAFGYDIINGKYMINEAEAAYVRYIFNEFLNNTGVREIAVYLNQHGVKTKRGGRWENRTIEYILRNPVYIGKIRWNTQGKTVADYHSDTIIIKNGIHSPIIDPKTFDTVQKLLQKRKKIYAKFSHQTSKNDYMLRGLVRCSNCMSTLVLSNNGLQCHSYAKGNCLVSHYISLDIINDLALSAIDQMLSNDNLQLIRRSYATTSAETNHDLEKEYIKLARVKEAYENGIDTIEEYRANKTRIEENIQRIKAKILPDENESEEKRKYIKRNKAILNQIKKGNISEKEKNMLLRSFVDHIVFNRAESSVSVFLYM